MSFLRSTWARLGPPRAIALLVAAAALLGLVVAPALIGSQQGTASSSVPLHPDSRPNVVVVVSDDQSMQTEPFMRNIRGPAWTRMRNAYINTSLCCPSRATILSGLYSHHTGVNDNAHAERFDDDATVAKWLQDDGYRTALIGKYLNHYPFDWDDGEVPPNWDEWIAFNGGTRYYDYELSINGDVQSYGDTPEEYSTDVLRDYALDFIDETTADSPDQPFFLYFTPFGVHGPRIPAPRDEQAPVKRLLEHRDNYNRVQSGPKPDWVKILEPVDDQYEHKRERGEARTILSVDDAIGALESKLREVGVLKDTVIIFISDNGFSYGSHRLDDKNCHYEECAHVPMAIRAAGERPQGLDQVVSNVDIAPTIADLAGVEPSSPVDGASMLPLLNGQKPLANGALLRTFNQRRKGWGIATPRYKYFKTKRRHVVELYDLGKDPFELRNVANYGRYRPVVRKLAKRTRQLRLAEPDYDVADRP